MNNPIPCDIDLFLFTLGTFEEGNPEAFEEYAKRAANLLWGKYVLLAASSDATIPTFRIDRLHVH
jgi:hypothetical protein